MIQKYLVQAELAMDTKPFPKPFDLPEFFLSFETADGE